MSLSAHGSILKTFFGEPSLVYVGVILLVEVDKMGEYLYPRTELGTPRVYVCIYTMVMDASTRRWILILPKFDEPFGPRFHFWKNFGGTNVGWYESHTLGPKWKNGWISTSSYGVEKLLGFTQWSWTHQQGDGFSYYQSLTSLPARGSIFGKILGEPMLVDMRVILLVQNEKMGEYPHPHMESKNS